MAESLETEIRAEEDDGRRVTPLHFAYSLREGGDDRR